MIANGVAGDGEMSAIEKEFVAETERSANAPTNAGLGVSAEQSDAQAAAVQTETLPDDIIVTGSRLQINPFAMGIYGGFAPDGWNANPLSGLGESIFRDLEFRGHNT